MSASAMSAHVITQLIHIYFYIFVRQWGMGTSQRVSGHAHHACVRRTVRAPFFAATASSFELLQWFLQNVNTLKKDKNNQKKKKKQA